MVAMCVGQRMKERREGGPECGTGDVGMTEGGKRWGWRGCRIWEGEERFRGIIDGGDQGFRGRRTSKTGSLGSAERALPSTPIISQISRDQKTA